MGRHWEELVQNADIVIHNGAEVYWGKTYKTLKSTNVQGALEAVKLCELAKACSFVFVSSTSILDTKHFVQESERAIAAGLEGISESDDLQGSRRDLGRDLGTGYGQSKWFAEYLVRECGKRGLRGCIVRPGYVSGGGSKSGDEFCIW